LLGSVAGPGGYKFLPDSARPTFFDCLSDFQQSIDLFRVVSWRFTVKRADDVIVELQVFQILGFEADDFSDRLSTGSRLNIRRQLNCLLVGPIDRLINASLL
jgi:hypothetical protein